MQSISIQEMVDKGEPIYVINRSVQAHGKELLLVLSFPHPTNSTGSTVKIPCIKYPINLSERVAPPSAIPLCVEFVKWVNDGVLEVVPADKARKMLENPEAKAAIDSAYRKLKYRRGDALKMREDPGFRVRTGGDRETHAIADLDEANLTSADFLADRTGAFNVENELSSKLQQQVQHQGPLKVQAEVIKIRPKITNFCQDLIEDPSLKGDYLTELKSWDEAVFSDDELGYMLQTLSKFDNICTYLRSVKAKRVGVDEDTSVSKKRRKRANLDKLDDLDDGEL